MTMRATLAAPAAHADDDAFKNEIRNSPRGHTLGPSVPLLNSWFKTEVCNVNLEGATDEAILNKMQRDMAESGVALTITDAAVVFDAGRVHLWVAGRLQQ